MKHRKANWNHRKVSMKRDVSHLKHEEVSMKHGNSNWNHLAAKGGEAK
jgi:hypothetical protein